MTASQFRSQPFDRCQRPAHVFKCCLKSSFFSSSEIKSKNEATSSNYNSVSGLETELEMSYIDSNDSWARGMATGGNKASLALNLYLFRFFFLNWSIVDLQCVSFCCTAKRFSYILVSHYGLSQSIEHSSLRYTVGLVFPSCIYQLRSADPNLPLHPFSSACILTPSSRRNGHKWRRWKYYKGAPDCAGKHNQRDSN